MRASLSTSLSLDLSQSTSPSRPLCERVPKRRWTRERHINLAILHAGDELNEHRFGEKEQSSTTSKYARRIHIDAKRREFLCTPHAHSVGLQVTWRVQRGNQVAGRQRPTCARYLCIAVWLAAATVLTTPLLAALSMTALITTTPAAPAGGGGGGGAACLLFACSV